MVSSTSAQILAAYVADLQHDLAPDRLAAYQPAGGNDLAMVTTYFWNRALCRELHLCLSVVEVTMRNGIHRTLAAHTGHPDWYDHIHLLPRQQNKINSTKVEISNAGKPLIPGRVIAGLDFGFWTSLLSAGAGQYGYGATLWSPNNAALVGQAFPFLTPLNQYRSYVHNRFNTIRLFRNRISHHEPIWRGFVPRRGQQPIPLSQMHDDIIDAVGWVSPVLESSVRAFDRFPATLKYGQGTIETEIKQHLNIP